MKNIYKYRLYKTKREVGNAFVIQAQKFRVLLMTMN